MSVWKLISATEPTPGKVVLLAFYRPDPGDWVIATGDRGPPKNERWDDDDYTGWHMEGRSLKAWDHIPTHWQPLPVAPGVEPAHPAMIEGEEAK